MKYVQMFIGFMIGVLFFKSIDVHGFIKGTLFTIVVIIVAVLIKKFINSVLAQAENEFTGEIKKQENR